MAIKNLSIERQLILLTAIEVKEDDRSKIQQIVNSKLNWSEVIFQAITHRTLNMLNYNLDKFQLLNCIEKELQRLFKTQWHDKKKL